MMDNPNELMTKRSKSSSTIRWLAYISSSLLFVLWGSFFIEHLPMFFSPEVSKSLPTINWIIQGIHLILLLGYLMVFKWPKSHACSSSLAVSVYFP
jgi:hypothetical protein